METVAKKYLPAAGRTWALPLYDPFVKLIGVDRRRVTLLEQAALHQAHSVLDIGCGTGTLALSIKQRHPGIEVIGLDPDPLALAKAERKTARRGISVRLERGFCEDLPFADRTFDRVVSTFMFHHLGMNERTRTLSEVRRVLKPGGSFHMVDFVKVRNRGPAFFPSTVDVLESLSRSGFVDVRKVNDGSLLLGIMRIAYYRASAA